MKHGKLISRGSFAEVYELTEDTVLRKSSTEVDGFRCICWLTTEERERFALPVIKEVDEEECSWAIVEKLQRCGDALFQDMGTVDWCHINACSPVVVIKNFTYPQLGELFNKAIALLKYMVEEGYPVTSLDLHPRNIMKRADGTLVISDPFGELDI